LQVHTEVVNRKTTITTFPDITFYGSINSDSDSNEENMARGKRHSKGRRVQSKAQTKLRNNKSKARNCDKCHNAVANGIDMYRFHHTGLTVCKNCWITMDPNSDKLQRRSRQIQSNLAETKLCAVFLTDVLSQELYKKEKTGEEKDKDDNTSCGSSQEEAKSSESSTPQSTSSKTRNHIVNGKAKRGRKRKIDLEKSKSDVERTPLKVTKLNKERLSASEMTPTKTSVDAEQQPLTKKRGRKRISDEKSSDSDGSQKQKETHRMKLNDRVNKPNRKKQKTVVEETTSNTRSDSSDETSNDSIDLKSRIRSTSSSTVSKKDEDKNTRARTRSSSMSSTEMTSSMEFKSPKSPAQLEVKTEYTCNKCNKKFDTKLANAKHRLTHLKQAALKLEKLTVPSVKENQETELESQDEKISEEARSNKTTSADKCTDDLSEEIAINIEDDTDDEEIFSLSSTENAKKKTAKKKTDEDVIDVVEPNEEKSESRIEEESANKGNIKIKKCEESIAAPDETLEIENDKDRQDKDIKDKHTTKDKDETSADRDNDKSEDKDTEKTVAAAMEDHENVDKEGDKDVNVKNDTEVSSIEKEKTTSECNNDKDNNAKDNDKDDLHEETTRDNEMINSPILSICNTIKDSEDHNENCKTNLENNCKDQNETIEESEIQCDLMDGSSKEDTKEPKEDVQQILSIDKTGTLSDKNDFNDIIVINEDKVEELEKLQNKSQENVEIDIADDDKSNSAKDIIISNFLNGEKHDEVKDNEDDVTIIPINSDCNDDATKHDEVTEETVPTDNSKKRKLEEELKELEDLVEDNAMNDEYEVQENSTYIPDNSSADAANEILKEVFDLAAAEVQHREESNNIKTLDDVEMETLENISREIRKSADMPSLDPISIMEIDDDNGITLD